MNGKNRLPVQFEATKQQPFTNTTASRYVLQIRKYNIYTDRLKIEGRHIQCVLSCFIGSRLPKTMISSSFQLKEIRQAALRVAIMLKVEIA